MKEVIDEVDALKAKEDNEAEQRRDAAAASSSGGDVAPIATAKTVIDDPTLSPAPGSLTDMTNTMAVKQWYRNFARKKMLETVMLVADSGKSETTLATLISQTTLGMQPGDLSGHAIIFLDVNLSGESKTAPHIRTAPFRKDQVQRLFNAVMQSRRKLATPTRGDSAAMESKVNVGDLYMYLDGGKKGHIINCFSYSFCIFNMAIVVCCLWCYSL